MRQRIYAARIFTGDEFVDHGWVQWEDGIITDIGQWSPEDIPAEAQCGATEASTAAGGGRVNHYLLDHIACPGFVDQHSHGGAGAAFTEGADAARRVLGVHRSHGTTSMVASLVTDSIDNLDAQVRALRPLVEAGELVGIHLEGPWLSHLHKGAHQEDLLRDPLPEDIARLVDASGNTIVMATLAVEREHGIEAVADLVSRGIIAAPGHTDATNDQTMDAIAQGANVATHLFNAMPSIHHRAPGPVIAFLNSDDAVVELITDGVHLHAGVVHDIFERKAPDVVLVTDAMAAAGYADGNYLLGPLAVEVKDGVARLVEGGAIAGSTLTLDRAIQFCVRQAGVDVGSALRAATSRPAQVLGRTDIGSLRVGTRADIVALDLDLEVKMVVYRGDTVPVWSDSL